MHAGEPPHLARAPGRARGRSSPGVQRPFIAWEDEWVRPGGISTAKNRWNSVWTCFLDCETNWKIFIQILFILFFLNPTSLFKLPWKQLVLFWELSVSWRREPLCNSGTEMKQNTGGQASIRRQDKLFKKVDNLRAFQRKVEILLIEWACGRRGLGSLDRRETECAPLGSPGSSPKHASPTVDFTTHKRSLGFQSLWQEFLSKQTFPGGLLIKLFRVKLFAYFGETPCLTPSCG